MNTKMWRDFQICISVRLIETNITANRKAPKSLDSFQRLEVVEAPLHALDTDTKQANIASNAETQTKFPKRDCFSLVTRETQTEGKLAEDAMTDRQGIYIRSEWSYSTEMPKHRCDKTA